MHRGSAFAACFSFTLVHLIHQHWLLSREKVSDIKNIVEVAGNAIKLSNENGSVHNFAYDHCFWSCDEAHPMYASQQSVYTTLARPLLDKSYEGYNVCLFAYGQTGSGKSYT